MKLLPSRIRAFRPTKTWVVLGAAVAIGMVAALGARSYLSNRVAELEARARGEKIAVVVAKDSLGKGAKLTTDTVAVRNIPLEFAHSSAVVPDQFERIDGEKLAFPVKAGEPILWSLIEGKKVPTFSARVESGRRAITVPVDEINSISGLLEPGDLIDLLVTVDQKGKKVTAPLIQSVQVLATGQRAVDDPKTGERRMYSTVTLDTEPKQAQNIIVARDAGKITALLRNPQDKTNAQGGLGDLAALLGAASLTGGSREVPVLYGGAGGKVPVDGLTLGSHKQPAAATEAGAPQLAAAGPSQSAQPSQPAASGPVRTGNGIFIPAPPATGTATGTSAR